MQRLFPNPVSKISVEEAYGIARNRVATPNGNTRPTIGMCMVMSIDGSTVVDGNSRALGGPADLAVLLGLRKLADVIIVGASTVVVDDYGPPSKPGLRVGVVTRSATIDTNMPLFTSGSGFLITTETAATPADVDWVVPHQANARIIEATAKKLGLDADKVVLTVDQHANTSAASVPLALDVAVRDGRIKAGDVVVIEAMGGGFTWGASVVRM